MRHMHAEGKRKQNIRNNGQKTKENVPGKAHTNTPTHSHARKKRALWLAARSALYLMKGERGEGGDVLEGRDGGKGIGARVFHQKDAAELSE